MTTRKTSKTPTVNAQDAAEFSRRRNLPGVEVRRMSTTRTTEQILSLCGREIGSKTELFTRGKTVAVEFFLPRLD